MTPGLFVDPMNVPKCAGIVVWSCVTRTRPSFAARARTSASVSPASPRENGDPEVDLGKPSDRRGNDDVGEISVRTEADAHQRTIGVCLFASASFW